MNDSLITLDLNNYAFSYIRSLTHSPNDNQHRIYSHSRYEIYYLISGNVVYQVENQSYKLNPGDLLLFNSKELHRPYFTSESSYERIIIFFTPEFCSHYNQENYPILQYFDRKKAGAFNLIPSERVEQEQLGRYFREIEEQYRSKLPSRNLMIELIFVRFLIHVNEILASYIHNLESEYDSNSKIEQIIAYLHNNLNQPHTLQSIEMTFFINRYYFSHQFKKVTGYSFKQYLIHKRISKATELLKLAIPPSEVCTMTGFVDYSSFYKAFKKITGMSPSHYS